MSTKRKALTAAAVIAVIAAIGGGIAFAVGGEGEEQVAGPDADKAAAAAMEAVGGTGVSEVEYQESGSDGFYEVEVEKADGSQVEVYVGQDFSVVGSYANESGDDDEGAGDDEAEGAEDEGAEEEDGY